MSDLKTILDRLVKENLHGPLDHATKNNAQRPTEGDEGLDGHDPRWHQLFDEFFVSDQSDDRNDDLLFFVQRPEVENGGLGVDPVFVKRKVKGELRILTPEQEAVVLWKDTFFLNVIVQLQCKLTVAVCSRVTETNPTTGMTKTSMTCTRKHVSKRVYALPTKSRMDVKEESVECSWPLIYYVIDDYEDMFEQLMVRDEEYLCVELAVTMPSATPSPSSPTSPTGSSPKSPWLGQGPSRGGTGAGTSHRRERATPDSPSIWSPNSQNSDGPQPGRPFPSVSRSGKITLFQGAAGFKSLLGIYQQKAASKVGKRFRLGPHTVPTEFVMMRGPGGRGHAQVAITASNQGDEAFGANQDSSTMTTSNSDPSLSRLASPPLSSSPLSPSEKNLPPIPGAASTASKEYTSGNGHGQGNGNGSGSLYQQQLQQQYQEKNAREADRLPSPTASKSPPKSFSTGSFFQSLRRISMATLAQAANHPAFGGGEASHSSSSAGNGPIVVNNNHHPANSHRSSNSVAFHPQTPGSPQQRPQLSSRNSGQSDRSGIILQEGGNGNGPSLHLGVGTRQEVEALVKQPQSLRCCMTFVNVPWTSIAGMLMDQAYAATPTLVVSPSPPTSAYAAARSPPTSFSSPRQSHPQGYPYPARP